MQQSNRVWCVKILAISLIALLLINLLAMHLNLYYILPWFDFFMHCLGGFTLGVLSLIISGAWEGRYHPGHIVLTIFLVTLAGGIAWEAVEFNLDRFVGSALQPSVLDTLMDIVADLLGAFAAYGILNQSRRLRRDMHQ